MLVGNLGKLIGNLEAVIGNLGEVNVTEERLLVI